MAEARGGLRQRIGRGPWAVRVDAVGGIAAIRRLVASPGDPLDLRSRTYSTWTVAGVVQVRSAGLEIGYSPGTEGAGISRATLIVRLPGVLGVF